MVDLTSNVCMLTRKVLKSRETFLIGDRIEYVLAKGDS